MIEQITAEPFARAHMWLRHIDPLYQAEIGIEREWDIDVEANTHGCGCSYCVESKSVKVEAVTAAEAIERAEAELEHHDFIVGIRPAGSNGGYADPQEIHQ
jgi:hypothetical protein